MSGETYAALREYCEEHKVSMSGTAEELLRGLLGLSPRQPRTTITPIDRQKRLEAIKKAHERKRCA